MIKINQIKVISPFSTSWLDYPNNYDHTISVYCVGCDNNCDECHNKELQNYNYKDSTILSINQFYNKLKDFSKHQKTENLVLIGGDFLYKKNINFTKEFLKLYCDEFNICLYTGKDIDYVKQNNIIGFKYIKCGKYIINKKQEAKKTDEYMTFASTNQILYDSNYNQLTCDGKFLFE